MADISRQAQSTLLFAKDLNDSQHVLDGTPPLLLVLPVIKFAHGVKLVIIDVVHGVLICPFTEFPTNITINTANITVT